ncbi:MAG: hypothetical protein JJ978_07470 [Roseivirga sp.]|uniref:DUF4350 domain-containing protein n=1 Tax=Roseivirga sp. TaxID=1964215 RepID=UPI001B1C4D34|nr:DUF4350 domain-containing protein [Roseivirga sp.]MBO6495386.1 hypothetical protein [Roseivirga sp.]
MREDKKYYAIIIFVFLVLFLIQYFQKEPTSYARTYSHLDKNPYGGYVLKDLLPEFMGGSEVQSLNRTLYEIKDSVLADKNLIIFADQLLMDQEDTDILLNAVNQGMTAFISAEKMGGPLLDTLKIGTDLDELYYVINANQDTVEARINRDIYRFKRDAVATYYSELDSVDHTVLAVNENDEPVAISVPFGSGKIVFNSTPLAFTNNYLFFEDNAQYASTLLSELPQRATIWSEYYQLGRIEAQTPLRVILTTPALKFAYGVTIISLLLFMVFEAKRKQRIIPIIEPLKNTSLEFVKTIGKLYLKSGNHKDIAEKKIQYFLEFIRTKYYLNFQKFDKDFFEKLSAKSGKDVVQLKKLFDMMEKIKNQSEVSVQELKMLNTQLENIYGTDGR